MGRGRGTGLRSTGSCGTKWSLPNDTTTVLSSFPVSSLLSHLFHSLSFFFTLKLSAKGPLKENITTENVSSPPNRQNKKLPQLITKPRLNRSSISPFSNPHKSECTTLEKDDPRLKKKHCTVVRTVYLKCYDESK